MKICLRRYILMNYKQKQNRQSLDDDKIIGLYWDRNEKAIEETDFKYGKYLYTISYNILHDRLDSEECLNDTYLGTWNRIPPARPNIFKVFLTRIMRNIAIDRFRKNTARKRIPSEMTVSLDELDECLAVESPEEEYVMREAGRIINSYLQGLADRAEFVFICRYYYADKISEIAKMLNVSDPTVNRELKKMRDEIRDLLQKEGLMR